MLMELRAKQVIGVAYTYPASRPIRNKMSEGRSDHSSHHRDFSYFKKAEKPEDIVKNGDALHLTVHPTTEETVNHWPEPEVAILLGQKHEIVAYALGVDMTAYGVEFDSLPAGMDPTHFGKCWPGSCAVGEFVPAYAITDDAAIQVTLRIERSGSQFYAGQYNTGSRLKPFSELPAKVVEYYAELVEKHGSPSALPRSKQIELVDGFLPEGTIILTGTAIVKTDPKYALMPGDAVTVSSAQLRKLRHSIT